MALLVEITTPEGGRMDTPPDSEVASPEPITS
jgi:hypothetical protein